MDIQKEKKAIKNLKAFYMEDWNLTEEERDDLDNLVSRIVAVVKTEAQAVPEGFVLVDKHQLAQLMANMDSFGKKALGDDYVSFADIAEVLDEAREPAND